MPRAPKLSAPKRKRQIIESARDVFAEQSYAKVGTADLAKAAGLSEAGLYRHFAGKRELFIATLRSTGPKLLDIWQEIASEVEDPLETLWAIGVHYYDHLKSHSGNMKIQFQAVSEADDPGIREALRENFSAFVRFVTETLDEGKRRGIVRSDVDSELLAWQFLGIGFTLDLIHLLGFGATFDRGKAEQWALLFQQTLKNPTQTGRVGPGVRAVSELAPAALEV